jgi:hypothetical protein
MSPQGDVGSVVFPRKALMTPAECCAKRNVEPHPLTTIKPALRFKGMSLRDFFQRKFVRSPLQFGGDPFFYLAPQNVKLVSHSQASFSVSYEVSRLENGFT